MSGPWRQVKTAIANLLARAVVQLVDDTPKMQVLQIGCLTDETIPAVERFSEFGWTSVPKKGAEVLVGFLAPGRDHPIVFVVADRRYRLQGLAEGDVAMHNEHGDSIIMRANRDIEVTSASKVKATAPDVEVVASTKVLLTTPLCEISGNLLVKGSTGITAQNGDVIAGTVHLKTHTHTDPQGGSVGPPT